MLSWSLLYDVLCPFFVSLPCNVSQFHFSFAILAITSSTFVLLISSFLTRFLRLIPSIIRSILRCVTLNLVTDLIVYDAASIPYIISSLHIFIQTCVYQSSIFPIQCRTDTPLKQQCPIYPLHRGF